MSSTPCVNIAVTFAVRLVQDDTVKTGFSHEIVRKQEVFASKKKSLRPEPEVLPAFKCK